MWPKSCLFVLVFGSRYTPIPMCAHTFADFVPEKHFLTLNILIFLLFLFAHTHTHIFCVNGLLLLPLLSLFCQFYSCVAYSVGGAGRWRSLDALLSFSSVNRHRCFCERAPKTFFAYFYGTRLQRAAYMFAIVRTHQPIFTHSRISFSSFVCFFPLYFT